MARQVDVKALISHIVRGDGADRCRICMGDTSEGQVYLGDTVMMDEDRAVTLSELLEIITGVQVPLDHELPPVLCLACHQAVTAAAAFRELCQRANRHWYRSVELLQLLPDINADQKSQILAVIKDSEMAVLTDIFKPDKKEADENSDDDMYTEIDYLSDEEPVKKKMVTQSKNSFECPNCAAVFKYPIQLYEHLQGSTDDTRACYICASIMSRKQLVQHIQNTHKTKIYSCMKCLALCKSSTQYRRHLEKFHSSKMKYPCDCGRRFRTEAALCGHVTLHLNKNCPGCDKLFRNRKCYMVHVKKCCNLDSNRSDTVKSGSKMVFEVENKTRNKKTKVGARGSSDECCICDYCGKSFKAKKFVRAHIEIVHIKNTHRPCPFCGKSYAAAHMSQHLKRHSDEPMSYKCSYCSLNLKTKLGYIQHVRLHTGEKPYQCQYCSETFSASSRRSDHIRRVHKNPKDMVLKHCCHLCPARFRLPFQLRHHVETVHNNKDKIKEFECPHCLIRFSSFRGLFWHQKTEASCVINKKINHDVEEKINQMTV